MPRCEHYDGVEILPSPESVPGCVECLATGGTWVHLRMCIECGHIGCCDSSPARHARKHHEANEHHLIRSVEPGEDWGYCYIHETFTRLG